jgi:hypothetical protein
MRSILRFAHTGEVLGITGQTIAGLVSLGSVILAWTGIALALRRFLTWRRRLARGADVTRGATHDELAPAAGVSTRGARRRRRRSATAVG